MEIDFVNSAFINGDNIFYKELKVKHLKVIYKCLIGDIPDTLIVIKNINNILSEITSLPLIEIEKLNFVDYFLLLFEIRCTSIGNIIFAELPDETKNIKIEINITKFNEIIKQIDFNKLLKTDVRDSFEIYYHLPTIQEISTINTTTSLDSVLNLFVKQINYSNTIIDFTKLNKKEIDEVFKYLPAKLTSAIVKKVLTIFEEFNSVNLISYIQGLENKQLLFNLNIQNLIILLKLIFGDHLLSLYENIFAICKLANFTPEYIENCSPGEYLLFVKKLEKLTAKEQPSNTQSGIENISNPFAYPDLPPITGEAQF